jgi:hypothetical protein
MYSMICYIPECICYGSENFGLGSLHDDSVGLDDDPICRDTYLFFYPEKGCRYISLEIFVYFSEIPLRHDPDDDNIHNIQPDNLNSRKHL